MQEKYTSTNPLLFYFFMSDQVLQTTQDYQNHPQGKITNFN